MDSERKTEELEQQTGRRVPQTLQQDHGHHTGIAPSSSSESRQGLEQTRQEQEQEPQAQPQTDQSIPPATNAEAPSSQHAPHSQNPTSLHLSNVRRPSTRQLPITSPTTMSPSSNDRVFPIRSVVSVDPSSTPQVRYDRQDSYFQGGSTFTRTNERRSRGTSVASKSEDGSITDDTSTLSGPYYGASRAHPPRLPPHMLDRLVAGKDDADYLEAPGSSAHSTMSPSEDRDTADGVFTTRFTHVVNDDGHAVITGRDGDLQRCEDEPIHIPGAVQSFGLLVALQEQDGKFLVRIVSENSHAIIGYTPKQLFALDSFTDILSDEQADNLLDHIDFVRDEETDVVSNGPELFTLSMRVPRKRSLKLWCAMHVNPKNPELLICELELENDTVNPPVAADDLTPDIPEDTISSNPTAEEFIESTQNLSKPLRVLRSARKSRGESAAMEVFNIMSQVQEQLAAAPTLELFLKILVGVVKELTGFHRVMIYQFDKTWNGRVVTELVDPRATKDLYKGLHFPAADIPKQARDLYKTNRVRLLYDRDQETARLVCRTVEDLQEPLDLTHSFLRAMSPIHIKYLANMAVRASMSISINAFDELWGLISCHSYGHRGMRVSFPIRKMCRLVGDTASRNIERLSYASRLQARKLINTVPTQANPSGYIIASSEDLLKLFDADFGLLCIQGEVKMLGAIEKLQEALAMLEYLKARKITSVLTSQDIREDFPDLIYPPGFTLLAGMLLVPLSASGVDFITLFRKGQLKEVKWAGNPYEKTVREGTRSYLEPRKSFKTWSETVVSKCREWTDEEIETAAVLCLVYGKFIDVWRQKEAALQNSQLTKLLLANSAHEVRTPLNAVVNYLEIALEGSLDAETRDYLTKSHSASKSLIYVINDLLDLTKTEEGMELITADVMDFEQTFTEACNAFRGDATRKGIEYSILQHPGLPKRVQADQRKVRQAISNVVANAISHTHQGSIVVEAYVVSQAVDSTVVEVIVSDTGVGMSTKKLDSLFGDLEQIQSDDSPEPSTDAKEISKEGKDDAAKKNTLGLGLAVVARIVRNMNGQLRLKSEEGKGSRFVLQFPFDVPETPESPEPTSGASVVRTPDPGDNKGEVLLVDREKERRSSFSSPIRGVSRKNSAESFGDRSLKSVGSMKSVGSISSARSQKSEVDKLIEAIQEPHMVEGKRFSNIINSAASPPRRPPLETRRTFGGISGVSQNDMATVNDRTEDTDGDRSGQQSVHFSNLPVKAVKMPDSPGVPIDESTALYGRSGVMGELVERSDRKLEASPSPDNMHVLVAEDDPVNSRIICKRLEKLGHTVHLTVNGQECANAYRDQPGKYDVVLMDMQMPIVDGATSTKLIRETEQGNAPHQLSQRAALNGRIPVIAVSASVVERERKVYMETGFDAWIPKPISFVRLSSLMTGIVDPDVRENDLYKPGHWEKGGWFEMAKTDHDITPTGRRETTEAMETVPPEELNQATTGVAVGKSRSAPQLRGSLEESSEQLEPITKNEPVESPAAIE